MAQVTIYLSERVAKDVRRAARKAGKSVSAYLSELASRAVSPAQWPDEFVQLYGSWKGEVPEVRDAPAEPVDDL